MTLRVVPPVLAMVETLCAVGLVEVLAPILKLLVLMLPDPKTNAHL